MGGSKWSKAKVALGLKLNSCLYEPRTVEDSPPPPPARPYDPATWFREPPRDSDHAMRMRNARNSSSSSHCWSERSSKSSKILCSICLETMKPGRGHAIFTAECSHTFHFHCIASNVKHGRRSCPVCRAQWKEIPFLNPSDKSLGRDGIDYAPWPDENTVVHVMRGIASQRVDNNWDVSSLFHAVERRVFDDDDEIPRDSPSATPSRSSTNHGRAVEVIMYPEVSAVQKTKAHDDFSILVHLKAPAVPALQYSEADGACSPLTSPSSRAPVDLVTVLDVSGSMSGTKLALLKRAMGFLIRNLAPSDRLCVIAFSSTARRLFHLRRMTHTGKRDALQAVNSLSSNGGTNIADGLSKAAKVMTERKYRNPVSSIMLLSDGQDTHTRNTVGNFLSGYQSLLPASMHRNHAHSLQIPVHAFGFGADHDAVAMHLISETSGGTFSFVESESVIQDAFAQCIGGILSVLVQELQVEVACIDPMLQLTSIKSGSYKTILAHDKRKGTIEVGDMYAEEERDFLVTTDIPMTDSSNDMPLIKVKCVYKDSISKNVVTLDSANDVKIQRPAEAGPVEVSMEVDKQRNRLRAAEAMAEARAVAELGDLPTAVSILENCRKKLSETVSARAEDRLCIALDAELKEAQERMVDRQTYESSGRAYVLSGLSSHSWQRATARGDSVEITSGMQAYQTPSMVNMVSLSQTMVLGGPLPPRPRVRPIRSCPLRPDRR